MKQDGGIVDIRAWREVSTVTPMWGGWAKPQRESTIMENVGHVEKLKKRKELPFLLYHWMSACAGLISTSAALVQAFS